MHPMLTATLFIITRTLNNLSVHLQTNGKENVAYITMEYYSAIERNGIGSFVKTWMDLETVIHSEASQKKKIKYCVLINCTNIVYVWNLEKKLYRWSYSQSKNKETVEENKHLNTKRESRVERIGRSWFTYIHNCNYVKKKKKKINQWEPTA